MLVRAPYRPYIWRPVSDCSPLAPARDVLAMCRHALSYVCVLYLQYRHGRHSLNGVFECLESWQLWILTAGAVRNSPSAPLRCRYLCQ